MIKFLPLIILLTSFVKAQIVFCPLGAEWRSLFTDFWPSPGTLNEKAYYLKDTVIGLETLKVIEHRRFFMTNSGVFTRHSLIRQKGDTIFIKNSETLNGWQILYNYAVPAGQSWVTNLSNGTTFTIQVDSVKYILVNGFNLRHLYVTYKSSYHPSGYFKTYIAERMGSPFLFNYEYMPGTDGNYLIGPLCYKDNQFSTIQFGTNGCSYENPTGLENNLESTTNFIIGPNPVNNLLYLKSVNENYQYILSNTIGQIVFISKKGLPQSEIDMTTLPSGIYYLRASENEVNKNTFKVIKD